MNLGVGNLLYSLLLFLLIAHPPIKGEDVNADEMSPVEYHNWVEAERAKCSNAKTEPILLERTILSRLKRNKSTNDQTLLSCIRAWVAIDSGDPENRNPDGRIVKHPKAYKLILSILALLPDASLQRAKVLREYGSLLDTAGNSQEAAKQFEAAAAILEKFRADVEVNRISSYVGAAESLYQAGHVGQAEKVYLEALSFTWWEVGDADARRTLGELYLKAGRGLIQCRKDNYEDLKETYFATNSVEELLPLLESAMRNLQKDPAKAPNVIEMRKLVSPGGPTFK